MHLRPVVIVLLTACAFGALAACTQDDPPPPTAAEVRDDFEEAAENGDLPTTSVAAEVPSTVGDDTRPLVPGVVGATVPGAALAGSVHAALTSAAGGADPGAVTCEDLVVAEAAGVGCTITPVDGEPVSVRVGVTAIEGTTVRFVVASVAAEGQVTSVPGSVEVSVG